MKGFFRHFGSSLPDTGEALLGTVLWTLAMGASAGFVLTERQWTPGHVRAVAVLYGGGGAMGWLLGIYFARLLGWGRSRERKVAAAILCLGTATIAMTAGLFALQTVWPSLWQGALTSQGQFIGLAFDIADALAEFALLGMRLFVPIGLAALLVASLVVARRRS